MYKELYISNIKCEISLGLFPKAKIRLYNKTCSNNRKRKETQSIFLIQLGTLQGLFMLLHTDESVEDVG
jgi:hypothetical protein